MGFFDRFRRKDDSPQPNPPAPSAPKRTGRDEVVVSGLDVMNVLDEVVEGIASGRFAEEAERESATLRAKGLDPHRFIRQAVMDEHTCATCRNLHGRDFHVEDAEFWDLTPPKGCEHGEFEGQSLAEWEAVQLASSIGDDWAAIRRKAASDWTPWEQEFMKNLREDNPFPDGCRCRTIHPPLDTRGSTDR